MTRRRYRRVLLTARRTDNIAYLLLRWWPSGPSWPIALRSATTAGTCSTNCRLTWLSSPLRTTTMRAMHAKIRRPCVARDARARGLAGRRGRPSRREVEDRRQRERLNARWRTGRRRSRRKTVVAHKDSPILRATRGDRRLGGGAGRRFRRHSDLFHYFFLSLFAGSHLRVRQR
jgi:hypothetical protein